MADRNVLAPEAFERDVVDVAMDLIGRTLHVTDEETGRSVAATVLETEAYGGADDPASHAAFRPGGRARAMFGPAGTIYVYAAYGMYPCLNIVTGTVGEPSAVLIRGILPSGATRPILGPGRSARFLGITLADHGRTIGDGRIGVSVNQCQLRIAAGPRVGITRGVEIPWRFDASQNLACEDACV